MVNSLMEKETKEALEAVTPCIQMVMIQNMLPRVTTIARTTIEPELERRLGHKVTDYDWQIYWQELEAKQRQENWDNLLDSLLQPFIDRQIIRKFVLEGN